MKDIAKIIKYSWTLKKYYIATMVFAIIVALLNQVTPFIFKFIVDALVEKSNGQDIGFEYFALWIFGIFLVNVIIALITNYSGYLGDILGVKLNTILSKRYYKHLLNLPLEYFDNQQAGKVTSRLDRSISTISQLIQAFANSFVGFFLTSAVTVVIMAYYAWPIALLLAFLFPFYIWLTALSSRSWQRRQNFINKNVDATKGRFVESVGQIRVVKSFVQESREFNFMSFNFKNILGDTKKQSREWHWYDIARRLGLAVIFTGIYGYIIWNTWVGNYTLGTLTLLLQLAIQAQFPLFASSFIVDNVQRARSGSRDYFEAMETIPTIVDKDEAVDFGFTEGKIEFKNVTFEYQKAKKVLKDVSFVIKPNSKVALVGESGEGKTTIANLILRFYEASGGSILVDDQDITNLKQKSLRDYVGVVFQDPALFSGTVRENISYSNPSASEKKIIEAAKLANAYDFINDLPKGLDTQIGERGVKLSGGQKQRLAIARAILKSAPILILDEATSSLDSKAEHEVQQALERLMANRTTIIIAHRLSTIASVDKIIGLKNGKVVEEGTPEELAKANGIYAELLALQQPTETNKVRLKKYEIET